MRTLAVQRQVRLSFARVAEICLRGIYHRLFRSLVTLSIVTVAVAFMMYVLSGNLISREVWRQARDEAGACKNYDRWLTWFETPMDVEALLRLAASCAPGDPRLPGLARWAGVDAAGLRDLQAVAGDAVRLLRAVDALPAGKRLLLTGGLGDGFLLEALLDRKACDGFIMRATALGGMRLPDGAIGVRHLVARYRLQRAQWIRLVAGRDAALRELHDRLPPGASISGLLAGEAGPLDSAAVAGGFLRDGAFLANLRGEARNQAATARLEGLLKNPTLRRDIAEREGVAPLDVTFEHLARVYQERGGPALVADSLRRGGLNVALDPTATRRLLTDSLRRARVLRIDAEADRDGEGMLGFSETTWWLIGVSVIVCIVGIANAMLMSVMERFREIATMKCLGARDAFVMKIFVLESCIQGVVGGVLGAAFGLLLALPVAWLRFGFLLWQTLAWPPLAGAACTAVLAGALLSAIASLYPARVAARLAPMEAMKVE